ncbi:uncharacterized protein B0P05DRAFT_592726 [Gilbertella persicaria]|uniref:uncharacterized protein n=1 Tax=Gilbertella persicaria TaxID=101096 RepID=UPI00221F6591|nr:uncharacterized protein B0P05DRAFT_592726 [Gilbertella persicaria]KAI8047301.1 hypothetical protein B0P05DRAFT_592726 [Gilbertella persicaria]
MSASNVLWNAAEWLENNYEENNGLPRFFVAGDYSYQNRDKAMNDYIAIVTLAKSSDDPLYSRWANAVSEAEFSILSNRSVEEFWDVLLNHENRHHSLKAYQKIKFINSDPSSSQFKPLIAQKLKRKQSSEHFSQPSRQRIVVNEVDGVFVPGLSSSIGSFIGTLASNSQTLDRKSRYFVTLGMNGILDMTDTTAGSRLSQLPEEASQACQNRFVPVQNIVNLNTIQKYEELLLLNENEHRKFLRRSLHRIKYSWLTDQNTDTVVDIVRDVYQYILKVHLYSPEVFTEKAQSFLSEQDYIIKLWGYLIETVFHSSGVMAHWGDTISSFSIKNGTLARMDLRLINLSDDSHKEALDVGNAEFAKKETESKYYKDLLKAVISSKIHLNELVENFPGITQEKVKNLQMPLCVVTSTTCYVYGLYLESRNLYILKDVCSMSIPLSLKEMKE